MKTLLHTKDDADSVSCRLTDALLRKRKSTIIHELVEKIIMTEEIDKGYRFTFNYYDEILFRLTEFIQLEKECCPFFDFNLSASGNSETISLSLAGPEGTREFIKYELEMV